MSTFFYLATPYSKYPAGIDAAYKLACMQTALLIRAGIPVFSPIAHTHGVAVWGNTDPLDHTIWMPADEPFMRLAKGLIVCMATSWQDSYGMKVEEATFRKAGKPVVYMEPGIVPAELLNQ